MDVHTPEQRSRNMRGVRAKDTGPELTLRRSLHSAGLRYRLHAIDVVGRPDLVFVQRRIAIFVHGCFWHAHSCPRFSIPATRSEFWRDKLEANRTRDARVRDQLLADGWRVLIVWECCLRGPARPPLQKVVDEVRAFISGHETEKALAGDWLAS